MAHAGQPQSVLTARSAGLVACTECGSVWPQSRESCNRCGRLLRSRDERSLQKVWAWWLAGLTVYIPANLYPMLVTTTLGRTEASTILGGVVELWAHGSFGVAAIVFFASIMIPVGKFLAIAYLALTVNRTASMSQSGRKHLFEVVEFIGRWSMIDVFVVAILSALVQLDFVASIHPGIAAVSFALSVAFTMVSAQSFDPRLIWDLDESPTS